MTEFQPSIPAGLQRRILAFLASRKSGRVSLHVADGVVRKLELQEWVTTDRDDHAREPTVRTIR